MKNNFSLLYLLFVLWIFLFRYTTTFCDSWGFPLSKNKIRSWTYQLQNLNIEAVGYTAFDLVVMDYSSDGCEEGEFRSVQIDSVKNSPGGDKIILAYMSIGEAEDYRFYWQNHWKPGNPSWLGPENTHWDGNYKVKFWDQDWQQIILNYTDLILTAGFDGVYLDIIDAYEYWMESHSSADQDMVDFVAAIAEYARIQDPDFLIFPQNGAALAALVPSHLNFVDGIGQEDLYYGYEEDGVATPSEVTAELEDDLNLYRNAGKLILTVDYPFGKSEDEPHFEAVTMMKIDSAYSKSSSNGYVPYCTVRNLNYLTINPGHEPETKVFEDQSNVNPKEYLLYPNFPNPFNTSTVVCLSVFKEEMVSLRIYDFLGREVENLWDGNLGVGFHQFFFMANDLSTGIYLVRMVSSKFSQTRKMILVK